MRKQGATGGGKVMCAGHRPEMHGSSPYLPQRVSAAHADAGKIKETFKHVIWKCGHKYQKEESKRGESDPPANANFKKKF